MTVPDDLDALAADDQREADRDWKLRDAQTTAEQIATFFNGVKDQGVPSAAAVKLTEFFCRYILGQDEDEAP